MSAPRKALPVVTPVRVPFDRIGVALNAAQFERAKFAATNHSGTSLEYLADAATAGASGWFLAPGDATAHGFDVASVSVAFVATFQGITHDQRPLNAMRWESTWAASKQKASDANRLGDITPEHALAVITHNVRRAVSLHRNGHTIAATLNREHNAISPIVIAAILGDDSAVIAARTTMQELMRSNAGRDAVRALRSDMKERGFRYTL